ncbi:Nif3-like dinuclear metal center hexameric protein [Marinobacterium jannaschii]|uniref:Nif3-like dinuclear metal center hexameric protein n=1 Tax=Marinobacterium jannaschii TaxID=64970 RepID=UPI0004849383|nr:Nif3-like dinuclear metal center hexameric protein [Marinobacterium jannaschii]
MSVKTEELIAALDNLLEPGQFRDYAPNGLQVEGCPEVKRLVSGVTASQALLDAAVEWEADAILVHHGYFWKGEDACIRGIKRKRLKTLLDHDINLLAYHLPLDAHATLGNNARLGDLLGLKVTGGLEVGNPRSIGLVGELETALTAQQLTQRIATVLGREPLHIDGGPELIRTLGWCSGGAQGYIEKAVALGLDAFISGEVSEPTFHSAQENGIHYFAAGHHATERYGAKAVGEYLAEAFALEHRFIDIPNPV